jgi:hypothetical protein
MFTIADRTVTAEINDFVGPLVVVSGAATQ